MYVCMYVHARGRKQYSVTDDINMYVCMYVQGHTLSSVVEATCPKRGLCDLTEGIACRVKHTFMFFVCVNVCMQVCARALTAMGMNMDLPTDTATLAAGEIAGMYVCM